MHIRKLELNNFRNYESLTFHPGQGVNILVGRNAQGKSGVLEALYVLATSKSHRTSKDQDMIKVGEPFFRILCDVERNARNDAEVEVVIGRAEGKIVKLDTVRQQRVADIIGQLNAVIFSSSDIDMIRGEPSERRRFLNLEISQYSPQYVYALGSYKKALDQRNSLLKNIKLTKTHDTSLDAWDEQLARYGAIVICSRAEFVGNLHSAAGGIYASLCDSGESLEIAYKTGIGADNAREVGEAFETLRNAILERREQDIMRGTTSIGPHRDDIGIKIDGLPAKDFASQGQQRTAAISLKLAEIGVMESVNGESPIVLLDDVAAELDDVRRSKALEYAGGRCQTFVTTTSLAELKSCLPESYGLYEVSSGSLRKMDDGI